MADRVPPTVRLLVPCEEAQQDQDTDQLLILNPLALVGLPPDLTFPIEVEELSVYAQVTHGIGVFPLSVEVRQVYDGNEEDRVVHQSEPLTLTFPTAARLEIYHLVFQLKNVPFDEPGIYEFRLLSDAEEFESPVATLRVLDQRAPL